MAFDQDYPSPCHGVASRSRLGAVLGAARRRTRYLARLLSGATSRPRTPCTASSAPASVIDNEEDIAYSIRSVNVDFVPTRSSPLSDTNSTDIHKLGHSLIVPTGIVCPRRGLPLRNRVSLKRQTTDDDDDDNDDCHHDDGFVLRSARPTPHADTPLPPFGAQSSARSAAQQSDPGPQPSGPA